MVSIYLDEVQIAALERLKERTQVPTATRIRDAVYVLLRRYNAIDSVKEMLNPKLIKRKSSGKR